MKKSLLKARKFVDVSAPFKYLIAVNTKRTRQSAFYAVLKKLQISFQNTN